MKEWVCALRERGRIISAVLFAAACVCVTSFSMQGRALAPHTAAALVWIVLFFASLTVAAGLFSAGETPGTMNLLRLNARATVVFTGKVIFTFLLLAAIAAISILLFIFFSGQAVSRPGQMAFAAVSGVAGLAVTGTVLSAIATGEKTGGALLAVVSLPVTMPLLWSAIALTSRSFGSGAAAGGLPMFMSCYCVSAFAAGAVLFESIYPE